MNKPDPPDLSQDPATKDDWSLGVLEPLLYAAGLGLIVGYILGIGFMFVVLVCFR
jgi:hypothetical protein